MAAIARRSWAAPIRRPRGRAPRRAGAPAVAGGRAGVLLHGPHAVGNTFAIVAFALLWVFLAAFFFVVLRTLIARSRKGGDDRWEHGL